MSVRILLHALVLLGLSHPLSMNAGTSAAIPQCSSVSMAASYLAQVSPHEGPGFLLTISNDTDAPVILIAPVPTSAHWYAQSASGRWLWRASTGAGGGLVDAMKERGPVLAYRPPAFVGRAVTLTVLAHAHVDWLASIRDNPALRFRPGCERCRNPEDRQYRAVLAYAYLPPPGQPAEGLLSCGLRSNLVVMPPLE